MRGFCDLNAAAAKVEETNDDSDAGPNYFNNLQNSPLARWWKSTCFAAIAVAALEFQVTDQLRRMQLPEGCFLLPLSGHIFWSYRHIVRVHLHNSPGDVTSVPGRNADPQESC